MVDAAGLDAIAAAPCAAIGIRVHDGEVAEIRFLPASTPVRTPADAPAARTVAEIRGYLDDPLRSLDLPLAIAGSEFQRRVWGAIQRIPPGATRTYGDLATELRSTARAVGQACGDNRLPIAIPCHRVVAARGLGGFAHRSGGIMLEVKRWLLAHESRTPFALVPPPDHARRE